MVAHVYIDKHIGDMEGENGEILKGINLVDVVGQVESFKGTEEIHVHIDSPGGSVEVGNEISNYLKSIKNLKTFAENLCASIATKIHLSAKPENRFVQEGCVYMIHNPLFMNVSGNASELKQYASYLEPLEKELVQMYSNATGLDKTAIKGMMNQETEFTPEECVKLGFASEVVPKAQFKAVAFFNKQSNHINTNTMSDQKKSVIIKGLHAMASLVGVELKSDNDPQRNAMNINFTAEDGTMAMTPFEDLVTGDAVTLEDGTPAPDGNYTSEDGLIVITVVGGAVSTIENVDPESDLKIQVVALQEEVANLKTQLSEKETEIQAYHEATTQAEQVIEAANVEIESLKSKIVSNHKPVNSAVTFRKPNTPEAPKVLSAQEMKDRKAEYKSK